MSILYPCGGGNPNLRYIKETGAVQARTASGNWSTINTLSKIPIDDIYYYIKDSAWQNGHSFGAITLVSSTNGASYTNTTVKGGTTLQSYAYESAVTNYGQTATVIAEVYGRGQKLVVNGTTSKSGYTGSCGWSVYKRTTSGARSQICGINSSTTLPADGNKYYIEIYCNFSSWGGNSDYAGYQYLTLSEVSLTTVSS